MKRVFADTHFFIALLNSRDEAHVRAVRVETGPTVHLITTRWVLTEVAVERFKVKCSHKDF